LSVDREGEKKYLLINRAYAFELLGDYEGSIATLRQAASLVAPSDRRMQWVLRFNLAGNLCHVKRFAEAESLVDEVRALAVELGNGLDLLRTRWLQGWLAAGLGRRKEAMATLAKVCDDFAEFEIAYDALLAALELAVLHLEEGQTAEVKHLAVRLAPLFQGQGVHREALAALQLFREAAQSETLTATLARQLADYLYRARHNPDLRFEGGEGQGRPSLGDGK
jgi:hypothetical protein